MALGDSNRKNLNIFYRIFWLNDDQLMRRSKFNCKLHVVLGSLLIVGAIVFYFYISSLNEILHTNFSAISSILTNDLGTSKIAAPEIKIVSDLMFSFYKFAKTLVVPISALLFCFGLVVLFQGVLYFRIHEIINSDT